jgi:hypothetical protein
VFSMKVGHGGTYILEVEEGVRDLSVFSMRAGCSGTYILNIEEGGRDQSAFRVEGGTQWHLHAENRGRREGSVSIQCVWWDAAGLTR